MGFDKLAEFTRTLKSNDEFVKIAQALSVFKEEADKQQLEKIAQANNELLVKVAELFDAQAETFYQMLEKFAESILTAKGEIATPPTGSKIENTLQGSEDTKQKPVMTAELVADGTRDAIKDPNVNTPSGVASVIHAVVKLNGPEDAPAAADIAKEVVRQAVSDKVIPPEEGTAAAAAADEVATKAVAATGE